MLQSFCRALFHVELLEAVLGDVQCSYTGLEARAAEFRRGRQTIRTKRGKVAKKSEMGLGGLVA